MRAEERSRDLTEEEVALATRLVEVLANKVELVKSLASRRGARACGCGCASYSVYPDGTPCRELGVLAAEASAKDPFGREHMLLLFTCPRGLHEIEVIPPTDKDAGFLPTPSQIDWVVASS